MNETRTQSVRSDYRGVVLARGGSMSDRPPIRFKLSDGSSWPRPAMESDEYYGVGWKCRYSPESLTREDLLQLASIADAYGYLLLETTQKRRDFVCREARRWVTGEEA
ncbi:hypothetical protein SEA_NITZEL_77 [Mycobacterium phage Nitzel]|uniref:Uncharacterized protein n=3 Tax=Caudoviricetes TaxID=2731619 RepID=A0A5J6T3G4_9CAUD|nr:hypothetical protein I5H70_gp77 [Mycobacterium phage Nitzel]QFG04924.1 hypothetical protein SEA_NITZEL_77 [Mycobacterium phage Nitzel]